MRYTLVFREPARVARAHPVLRDDADGHRGVDGGVDADGEVARVLHDDGRVEVLEAGAGPDLVRDPEHEREEDADRERDGHHLVRSVRTEHLGAKRAPRDGVRVVLLRILAGPQTAYKMSGHSWAIR